MQRAWTGAGSVITSSFVIASSSRTLENMICLSEFVLIMNEK